MQDNQLTLTDAWSQMRDFWLELIEEIEIEEQSKNSTQLNLNGGNISSPI